MKNTGLALFVLACALGINSAWAEVAPAEPVAIDLTPVIRIGDFTTSRYLFEKAYRVFSTANARRSGPKPQPAEIESWFRLYLAQQVIKADLVERQHTTRPEVVELTERMARYMLTQPHGPLYRELGGADRVAFRRERRVRILQECAYSANPENIARLWAAVAPVFTRGAPVSEADVASISSFVLATYSFREAARRITAADYVRDFQQGIARAGPRDARTLGEQIEDIVVAEYDWDEATRRHLDQTPQFLEDRRNFALNQALVLYENEVLVPQIAVSDDELTTRYQAQIARYLSPVEITGTLALFSNPVDADRGRNFLSADNPSAIAGRPQSVIDPFVIRRDDPASSIGVPYALIASMPVGRSFGPFEYEGKSALFLKRTEGARTPMPFEQVRKELRQQLQREKTETLERDYLARNLNRVELHLDPAAYGMSATVLTSPSPLLK